MLSWGIEVGTSGMYLHLEILKRLISYERNKKIEKKNRIAISRWPEVPQNKKNSPNNAGSSHYFFSFNSSFPKFVVLSDWSRLKDLKAEKSVDLDSFQRNKVGKEIQKRKSWNEL